MSHEAPSRTSIWLQTIRPKTLFASIAPVLVGSALAWTQGSFNPTALTAALFGAFALQIIVNLHNDLEDFKKGADTESRLGPARASQMGWLTEVELKQATGIAVAVAVFSGLYLASLAGWPIVLIGVTGLLTAFAYTGGPFPLAYLGFAEVFVLLFFGFAAVIGTLLCHGGTISKDALWLGAALGSGATSLLVVNNLRDRFTDATVKKRTLAVRFGADFARFEYAFCWIACFFSIVAAAKHNHPGLYLPLLLAPAAFYLIGRVFSFDGSELNKELAFAGLLNAAVAIFSVIGLLLCG